MMKGISAYFAAVAVIAAPLFAQAPPPPPPQTHAAAAVAPAGAAAKLSAAVPTKFVAADVRFTAPYRVPFYSGAFLSGDRFIIHQATMMHLVSTAYNLKGIAFVGGGPTWVKWDRYDIMAKVPPGTTLDNARLMLQDLLAERFKLVVHKGDVQVPAYLLTAANGKLNLKPSTATEEGSCQTKFPDMKPGTIPSFGLSCHAVSMDSLAKSLDHIEERDYVPYNTPVVNSTGVKGLYDLDLKWTPKWFLVRAGSSGITVFQALVQVGLDLELKTTPQAGIVIDSVNREPTPNASDLAKVMPPLPPPQFEVATIRPAKPDEPGRGRINGDEMTFQNIPLKFAIDWAWDLDPRNNDTLVAPKWIDSDKIDIHAKIADSDLGRNSMGGESNSMNFDNLRPMIRSFLIDRFEIKYHMENRPIDVYKLVVADPKLASAKLTKAGSAEQTACTSLPASGAKDPMLMNMMLDSVQTCVNTTMDQFAGQLHRIAPDYFFYPVEDDTGIKGAFDFTMDWSSARVVQQASGSGSAPGAAPASEGAESAGDPNGAVSFFDAIKKQLGLKVIKEKRPEPVLVIDHIDEQPTEN